VLEAGEQGEGSELGPPYLPARVVLLGVRRARPEADEDGARLEEEVRVGLEGELLLGDGSEGRDRGHQPGQEEGDA
jgi:hypothetical protein